MKRTMRSRGLTLIELLTVVTLVIVIASIAIPAVRILTRDLKIREAARDLQIFLADVQSEAKATGSAGVWIERSADSPNASLILYRVTTPPPYSGDVYGAKAILQFDGTTALVYFPQATCSLMDPSILVRSYGVAGNRLRLEYKGAELFLSNYGGIQNDPVYNQPAFEFEVDRRSWGTGDLPVGTFTNLSFEVFSQPIKRSTRFLQLPDDTYLDLSKSGFSVLDLDGDTVADSPAMGSELGFDPSNPTGDILVMFGRDGAVDWVGFTNDLANPSPPPSQTLYLLLCMDNRQTSAELDPVFPPTNPYGSADPNVTAFYQSINEPQNLWVAFGRNGRLSISENSEPSERTSNELADVLRASRSIARQQIQIQAD